MADDSSNGGQKQESKDSFGFVDSGPPPNMRQRELIFDSLTKIVTNAPVRRGSTSLVCVALNSVSVSNFSSLQQGLMGAEVLMLQLGVPATSAS